jgi:hypothetical protein
MIAKAHNVESFILCSKWEIEKNEITRQSAMKHFMKRILAKFITAEPLMSEHKANQSFKRRGLSGRN